MTPHGKLESRVLCHKRTDMSIARDSQRALRVQDSAYDLIAQPYETTAQV